MSDHVGNPEDRFSPVAASNVTNLFFCKDDNTQQLVFQSLHGDGEVHNGRPGRDLGGVGRVTQLGGDVQDKSFHDVNFLVSNFHLLEKHILAHQIEKSNVLPHVRNSYLTLVISPRRTLRSSVLF